MKLPVAAIYEVSAQAKLRLTFVIRPDFDQWRRKEVARLLSLVEEESRYYQRIVANFPSGILVLSESLQVLGANRAFCQLFGVSSKEIQEHPLQDIFYSPAVVSTAQRVLRDAASATNVLISLPVDGKEKTFRAAFIILHPTEEDGPSQEEHLLLILEDLSSLDGLRHRAEDPLQGLSDLLAYSDGVFWEADPQSLRFLFVTGAVEGTLGYPAAQWTAEPEFWIRHIHPEDRQQVLSQVRAVAIQKSPPQVVEYRMLTVDGVPVWVRDVVSAVVGPNGEVEKLRGYLKRLPAPRTQSSRFQAPLLESGPLNAPQLAALAVGVPLLTALVWYLRRGGR